MVYLTKLSNLSRTVSISLLNRISSISIKSRQIYTKIHVKYCFNDFKTVVNFNDFKCFSTKFTKFTNVEDNYYIRDADSDCSLLGVTKNKFKDFNEIVFINFTEERELKKGDYLFSVEDSKTLFDFYSPLDCTIEEINHKFINQPTQDILNELFNDPENINNYLVKIKRKLI